MEVAASGLTSLRLGAIFLSKEYSPATLHVDLMSSAFLGALQMRSPCAVWTPFFPLANDCGRSGQSEELS